MNTLTASTLITDARAEALTPDDIAAGQASYEALRDAGRKGQAYWVVSVWYGEGVDAFDSDYHFHLNDLSEAEAFAQDVSDHPTRLYLAHEGRHLMAWNGKAVKTLPVWQQVLMEDIRLAARVSARLSQA